MLPRSIKALTTELEDAKRMAAEARRKVERMIAEIWMLVDASMDLVARSRHSSAIDIENARAELAEAQALLERAEKLTP
jgi:hypothetical protein